MYVQITTRCNMTCDHCCYSCTANGDDMSIETFKKAIELVENRYSDLTIGGGEPTIHRNFREFIGLALAADISEDYIPWMATNGKETETALKLARLAKRGVVAVELSQDEYHDPIDYKVINAFDKPIQYDWKDTGDRRGVRDITHQGRSEPIPAGRAADFVIVTEANKDECVCPDLVIDPKGNIWACGCKKTQFGTLENPQIPEDYEIFECYESELQKTE